MKLKKIIINCLFAILIFFVIIHSSHANFNKQSKTIGLSDVIQILQVVAGMKKDPVETKVSHVLLTNTSDEKKTNTPITIGHVFKKGDIPDENTIKASFDDGTEIPVQADNKTFYDDGSVCHSIISFILPELEAGASKRVNLISTNSKNSIDSEISISELLNKNYNTKISINLDNKNYLIETNNLLTQENAKSWLSGELVKEWQVSAPLKTDDGISHPHLNAHLYVRAYEDLSWVSLAYQKKNFIFPKHKYS